MTTFIINKIKNKIQKNTRHKNISKRKKNRKMIEKIIPQEQIEKSEHRESSRLRKQPRKITKHSSHNQK